MRKTSKGRRRIEEEEFCKSCNKLKHDEKIMDQAVEIGILTARVEDLIEALASIAQITIGALDE